MNFEKQRHNRHLQRYKKVTQRYKRLVLATQLFVQMVLAPGTALFLFCFYVQVCKYDDNVIQWLNI